MDKVLTPRERLILIRKGNELFNRGEITQAARIFVTTAYKDGLIRVGDYYYFDQENPLKALYYYLESGYRRRIDEISERMAAVIKKWLREEEGAGRSGGGVKSGPAASPPPGHGNPGGASGKKGP